VANWSDLEADEPGLAAFGAGLLGRPPAYLATVRADGRPRVHPVTPILAAGRLFIFMEPTSPKGRDLSRRRDYALHNGVPDTVGTGGEFAISGRARLIDAADTRALAAGAASYAPADRYLLFELEVNEARCHGYGDVPLPPRRHWTAAAENGMREV
jgi:hypothetical protein